jgi:hypothetical protein
VFDENAADWSDAKEQTITPTADGREDPGDDPPRRRRGACSFTPIRRTPASAFVRLQTPRPIRPWGNSERARSACVVLRVGDGSASAPDAPSALYEVEVAKEMLFRAEDLIERKSASPRRSTS